MFYIKKKSYEYKNENFLSFWDILVQEDGRQFLKYFFLIISLILEMCEGATFLLNSLWFNSCMNSQDEEEYWRITCCCNCCSSDRKGCQSGFKFMQAGSTSSANVLVHSHMWSVYVCVCLFIYNFLLLVFFPVSVVCLLYSNTLWK